MKYGLQAFERLVEYADVHSILDVGSGEGDQAAAFRKQGKEVTTISLREPADFIGDYLDVIFARPFDALWCCHVLEHQPNAGLFLKKCFNDLRDDGILAITVPPLKHNIVGGHVSLWNAGLLLYNLILAGFDCSTARVSEEYGYNISVIVRKKVANLPELKFDAGDIELIAPLFPTRIKAGFDGRLKSINW